MPTIDLTDDQAKELRFALQYETDRLSIEIAESERLGIRGSEDVADWSRCRSLLREVLSKLEVQ
jgi:hypothetical protein